MAGLVPLGTCVFLVYLAIRTIYRVYLHPLRKIPGPKLAAATSAYEFYFNVVKGGLLIWELERLHELYGPIIRVGPNEVHIKDPNYYDEIYSSGARRREKCPMIVRQFDLDGSTFSSISPEDHRQRRALVDRFFSKAAIVNSEGLIRQALDKLCSHIERAHTSHRVIKLDAGFAGLTADVIHQYALGYNSGNLDQEDFNERVRDGISGLFKLAHLSFFLPILQSLMMSLPLSVLQYLSPDAFALASQKRTLHLRVLNVLAGKSARDGSIVEHLVSPNVPEHLRSAPRITNEGFSLIIGGTETTARSLAVGAYYLLSNEELQFKLREELLLVMPTPESRPTWTQLEQLPFMYGVIMETLRLSTGIASRSPRIAPTEALVYKNYIIPPGTLLSQTNYFVLMDPEIFADPHIFDPDRWTRAMAKGERLDRYLVNFSKGSRICLGMNLAYAELYLTLATLIRRFELELYETTAENVGFARDFGTPYPEKGNFSIKVLVKGIVQE